MEDIYTAVFDEYIVYLKKAKTNLASLKTDRIVQLQGFVENNKPTLAGVMLFPIIHRLIFLNCA